MTPTAKAQLQIHLCVLLWGFTPILGKLISLAGVSRYPGRIKCALLGWHALMHALAAEAESASNASEATP